MVAPLIRDFVPEDEIVSYLEACLRVYNRYGRRDNKYKARIKILVHELGVEEYRRQVEEEFAHMRTLGLNPPTEELDCIRAYFAGPAYETGLGDSIDRSDPAFALWVDRQVAAHKQPGYAIVNIRLTPRGGIPGDASAEQIALVAAIGRAPARTPVTNAHLVCRLLLEN